MKRALLNRTHGDVDLRTLRTYQDLFEGGATLRKRVAQYLPKNDVEPAAVHRRRCERAHYLNYVASILNYFASALMSCPPVFTTKPDADPFYAELREDADGQGTDLNAMLRDLVVRALVARRGYVRVEFPEPGDAQPDSLAAAQEAGLLRARLVAVPTEAIRHWKRDAQGGFEWVLEHECREELGDITEPGARITETWTAWYADGTARRWRHERLATDRVDDDTDVPEVDPPHNPCGAIPLVELALPPELWLANHLADPAMELFRKRNALSWAIERTCYTMPFFFLKDAHKAPTMGAGYYATLGVDEKVEWPAPPSAPFEVVSSTCRELVQELHRIAQQMALGVDNNASAIGRSGDSKAADHESTEVVLKAYGAAMREPAERLLDLVSRGRGEDLEWSVSGMDIFDLADAATLTEMALTSDPLSIPSPTYRRELFKSVVHAQLPHLEEAVRRKIDAEIDAGVTAEDLPARPDPAEGRGNAPQGDPEDDPEEDPAPGPARPPRRAASP